MVLFYLILFNEATFAHLSCKQSRRRTCFGFPPREFWPISRDFDIIRWVRFPQNCPEQILKECKAVQSSMFWNVLNAIGQVGTRTRQWQGRKVTEDMLHQVMNGSGGGYIRGQHQVSAEIKWVGGSLRFGGKRNNNTMKWSFGGSSRKSPCLRI